MTIRNETTDARTGITTAEVIDLDARTVTIEVDGQVQSSRALTDDEYRAMVVATNPAPDELAVIAARLVAEDNANPPTWQPDTVYLRSAIVLHPLTGDRWQNIHQGVNPWPLEARFFWANLDYVEPGPGDPWAEGDTFVVGDERVCPLDGKLYRCTTAHTAWVGTNWQPSVSPSLWTLA